jgi:AmiR/NasT family two-component response regulator
VKLVALVSRVTAEIERKAKVAGVRAVLKKPASGAELVEIIEVAAGVQPAAETA